MDVKAASQTDIQAVLQQMRALRTQAREGVVAAEGMRAADSTREAATVNGSTSTFGSHLKNAIDTVNQLQKTSSATANGFLTGEHNDLVRVMVDGQKSTLGFQAMVQVRNRMISAYQDIMNMPI